MRKFLMGSTSMIPLPLYSGFNERGGNGQGVSDFMSSDDIDIPMDDDSTDDGRGDFDDERLLNDPNGDSKDNNGITDDNSDPLAALFGEDENVDVDEVDSFDVTAAQTSLLNQLKSDVESFKIPDDAIPDDFDPRNRQHMENLLRTVGQQIIRTAVNATMKPAQASINRLNNITQLNLRNTLRGQRRQERAETELLAAIPAAGNPAYRGTVDQYMEKAMKVYKGDRSKALVAAKKALQAAGINPNQTVPAGQRVKSKPESLKTLDLYMPMLEPTRANPRDRARSKMTR